MKNVDKSTEKWYEDSKEQVVSWSWTIKTKYMNGIVGAKI